MYTVELKKNGSPKFVELDSKLPCKDGIPLFSGARSKLWVALIEKAWSKVHGSYSDTIRGEAVYAFRDLTGAPSFSYCTADYEYSYLKELMLNSSHFKYPMTAKAYPEFPPLTEADPKKKGLV